MPVPMKPVPMSRVRSSSRLWPRRRTARPAHHRVQRRRRLRPDHQRHGHYNKHLGAWSSSCTCLVGFSGVADGDGVGLDHYSTMLEAPALSARRVGTMFIPYPPARPMPPSPAPLLHLHLHCTHHTHTSLPATLAARFSSNAVPQLRHVPRACAQPSQVQVTSSVASSNLWGKSPSPVFNPQRVRPWSRPSTTICTSAMHAAIGGFPLLFKLGAVSLGAFAESATSTPFDGDKVPLRGTRQPILGATSPQPASFFCLDTSVFSTDRKSVV